MISDAQLYTLAIFLGSLSMLLILLYHYLEVNKQDDGIDEYGNTVAVEPGEMVGGEKKGPTSGGAAATEDKKGAKGGKAGR
ncbi:MAG: hypothetical protein M1831_003543 [Alyxoria varia]|nr:MAG: hypothetical protein M1831_003543 [Alyxoria varia]